MKKNKAFMVFLFKKKTRNKNYATNIDHETSSDIPDCCSKILSFHIERHLMIKQMK